MPDSTSARPAGLSQVIADLGSSAGRVLGAMSPPPTTPSELSNALGLDRSLGWRVWQLVHAESPEAQAYQIPGAAALRRFVRACHGIGVPATLTRDLERAFDAFESWVAREAGDRDTLRMMLDAGGSGETRYERMMFDANRYRLGVQVDASLRAYFLFPDEQDADTVSAVNIVLLERLRRLRAEARPVVAQRQAFFTGSKSAGEGIQHLREPLDAALPADGSEPPVHHALTRNIGVERKHIGAMIEDRLAPGQIGASGEGTLCLAELILSYAPRMPYYDTLSFTTLVTLPCRHTVFDLYLERSLVWEGFEPGLRLGDRQFAPPGSTGTDLSCPMRVTPVRSIAPGTEPGRIAAYSGVTQAVTDRIGIPLDRFIAFRVVAEYAPLAASLSFVAAAREPNPNGASLSERASEARDRERIGD